MLSHTFHHCSNAGIANTEPFPCPSSNICLAAGCAIKGHISNDHIFLWNISCMVRSLYDQFSARQSLAKIIIAVSCQFQSQTLRNKSPKALTACTRTVNHYRVFFQSFWMPSRNLRSKKCAKRPVCVI